jgi:hypothetical protein
MRKHTLRYHHEDVLSSQPRTAETARAMRENFVLVMTPLPRPEVRTCLHQIRERSIAPRLPGA